MFLKKNFFKFYTILKVTFHLQLLQTIGYISHIREYIFEPDFNYLKFKKKFFFFFLLILLI